VRRARCAAAPLRGALLRRALLRRAPCAVPSMSEKRTLLVGPSALLASANARIRELELEPELARRSQR
jgi:hypothetical protein